ncbi:MAG: protein phosphatase 2C domain-containing protein [Verrucomicrobiota bacterium]
MRPETDYAGRAIQGQREDQEDCHAFADLDDGRLLAVLADGAGGQASGELASRISALGFLDAFTQSREQTAPGLSAALHEANRRLAEFMARDRARRMTMATTLLAAVVDGRALYWISVGDSPLLLYRAGSVTQLNADHSGGLNVSGTHSKNVLRSALVGGRIPLIDWRREPFPLQEGDRVIVASDGLWTLSTEEIAEHLAGHREEPAADLARGLLDALVAKGKANQDNATIVVIKL